MESSCGAEGPVGDCALLGVVARFGVHAAPGGEAVGILSALGGVTCLLAMSRRPDREGRRVD